MFKGLLVGCEMVWNFFATCHGKGEVDGVYNFNKKRSGEGVDQTLGVEIIECKKAFQVFDS
jgi:hypothetical protein